MKEITSILISRTDNLGDVILTLPMAGAIKKYNPEIKVYFLGKDYAKPIVKASDNIDEFVSIDELNKLEERNQINLLKEKNIDTIIHVFPNKVISKIAKKANIPIRIGTSHRTFHLLTCNKLVNLGRNKSDLHEAQLNLQLLRPLGFKTNYELNEIPDLYGYNRIEPLTENLKNKLSTNKFNLVLHPKSKGSAREWGIENFQKLIDLLPENEFEIFITGTKDESSLINDFLQKNKTRIINLTGSLTLDELISFISNADGLVAASTGPLHIAAATGIKAVGIYAPMRPIHPGRWMPLGKNAHYIVKDEYCDDCKDSKQCKCIIDITPKQVLDKLQK